MWAGTVLLLGVGLVLAGCATPMARRDIGQAELRKDRQAIAASAATGYDLLKNASSFAAQEFGVLAAGFIASFVVALLSIKFLLAFVRTGNFIPFGIYCIVGRARLCLSLTNAPG